ncbi:MAG: hypothetical protein JSS27_18740 [Planctomycetes bacterium]|nr:hypothetical protein [Planctomycetota bacterium]
MMWRLLIGVVLLATLFSVAPRTQADDPAAKPEAPATKPENTGKAEAAKPAATKKPAQPAASLDDDLLDALGGDSKKKPLTPAEKPQPKKPSGASALDDDLLRELGDDGKSKPKTDKKDEGAGPGGGAEDSDDPLVKLNRQMRDAQQRLAQAETDEAVQKLQQDIVKQLEELIKQVQQQRQQQSSSSSMSQSKRSQQREQVAQPQKQQGQANQGGKRPSQQPARDSTEGLAKRETEKVDAKKLDDALKDIWGELPPRLRQQMLQGSTERFLPKYELLIEQYFKALAERKKGSTSRP